MDQEPRQIPRWTYALGAVLAVVHVIVYFQIMGQHYEGSWGGLLVFLIDLPASFAILVVAKMLSLTGFAPLLIGGTMWWFCVPLLFAKLIRRLEQGRKKKTDAIQQPD